MSAEETLVAFFREMNEWGLRAIEHHRSIDWGNTSREELAAARDGQRQALAEIYGRYCDVGKDARRLKDQGLSFNLDEPEYNEKHPIVSTAIRPQKTVIVVEGRDFLFRYELVNQEGRWWIKDNKKFSSKKNEKWNKHIL